MNTSLPIIDKFNALSGIIVALLTYILGDYWFLFAAFLFFNVADYISGCINSRKKGKLSSARGLEGIVKKFGYWIIICVSFMMSTVFINIGNVIGIDLHITSLIGWITLAYLIVNECRSILENLVEAGYNVPTILIKGLEVANKTMDEVLDIDSEHENNEK